MKRLTALLLALLFGAVLLVGGTGTTAQASECDRHAKACKVVTDTALSAPAVAPMVATSGNIPLNSTIFTGYKFWPYAPLDVCVALGATPAQLPIGAQAQAWNNATYNLRLNAEANCVTAGYSPSTRMTIDSYSAADGSCWKYTNTSYATADTFRRWTNNPVGWVNLYYEGCQVNKYKWTAFVIGHLLGLQHLSGQTWSSRVMSLSTSTTQYPSASTDGPAVDGLYAPDYFGWY